MPFSFLLIHWRRQICGRLNFSPEMSLKVDLWSGVFVAVEDVAAVSLVGVACNIGGGASAT